MGLFKSKEEKATIKAEKAIKAESKTKFTGTTMQQIGKLQQGWTVDLSLDPTDKKLHISNAKSEIDITIPYARLRGFRLEDETTLAQSGSTIGRAIVGGVLFGKTGAIVGSMSGKGNTKTKWYATLRYEDKSGEEQELLFEELFSFANKNPDSAKFERRVNEIAASNGDDITEL